MTRHLPYLLALTLGCGTTPAAEVAPAPAPPPPEPWTTWIVAADARPRPTDLPDARSVEARRARTIALARLNDPAAVADLARGLRDLDARVRDAAALGLGALERAAPPAAVAALLGAVAAERDAVARGERLYDLGRTGAPEALPALVDGLSADTPPVRRGACRGLGAYGLVGALAPEPVLVSAASRAADDPDVSVRAACAHAVGRAPDVPPGTVSDLARAAVDPDARVRALAIRALGRQAGAPTGPLAAGAADPDPFVALAALRALAAREDDAGVLAERLERTLDLLERRPDTPWMPVLLAALEAPTAAVAASGSMRTAAGRILARIARFPADPGAAHDWGLLHCAAARLVDLGAGAAGEVHTCGLGALDEARRAEVLAELSGVLARAGATDVALGDLRALAGHPSPRARIAVASAAAGLRTVEAAALVRPLLDDEDLGVRIACVAATAELLARERASHDDAMLEAILAGAPAPTAARLLDEPLRASLRGSLAAFVARDDLEGLVTFAGLVEAAADPGLAASLGPLLGHHNVAVRRAARAALDACDAEGSADAAHATPPAPRTLEALALDARIARIHTARGEVVVELWPEAAPTTVSRFAELADAHFYDGLVFHRVVPGFVAQGGDPRGDGYGGPEWSQRCEDGRAEYERGTVGMALAGRDTGGSQFFITITPQPHLDGRYTAFGRVIEGLEVVDRLMPGDVMTTVRVERGSLATAARVRAGEAHRD